MMSALGEASDPGNVGSEVHGHCHVLGACSARSMALKQQNC